MNSLKNISIIRAIVIMFFIITIAYIFLINQDVFASGGYKIEPSRFIIEMAPGTRATEVINVTNTSNRRLNLIANFYDWKLNDEYSLVPYQAGTLEETLDGMIRFNPRVFSLDPGERQIVRYTVSFPEDKEGLFERRGIIFFEHEDEFLNEGVGASIRTMIGTVVYVAPIGYNYTFSILDNIVLQSPDNQFLVGILAKNEGLKHARINVEYKLVSGEGRVLLEDRTEERVILPGEDRGIFFPLIYDFVSGEYEILYTVTFSDSRETLTNSIKFYVD